MNNYYNITYPISLGVTASNGDDFHVEINHIMTESEDGQLGFTGIFALYQNTFGLYKNDIDVPDNGYNELPDEDNPDYLGRILFDENSHWIYDGTRLTVNEQEQIGNYISTYEEGDVIF